LLSKEIAREQSQSNQASLILSEYGKPFQLPQTEIKRYRWQITGVSGLVIVLCLVGSFAAWRVAHHLESTPRATETPTPTQQTPPSGAVAKLPGASQSASSELPATNMHSRTVSAPENQTRKALPPYVRTESFIIDVPYYGEEDGFPVTGFVEDDYPLNDAYECLTAVLVLYAEAAPGARINQIAQLDTTDKRAEALVEALRYCLIEQIHQSERGSTKWGISATKGPIADYKPAIVPPQSIDYPPTKFLALIGSLPFGKNERIQMLYRNRPLRVPEGSTVELLKSKFDSNDVFDHWIFRLRQPDVFSLAFGVAPINAVGRVLPEGFPAKYKPQQSKYTTYSFAITMKIEIQRTGANDSAVDDLTRWSDDLWAAIRRKYDIKELR
jgi:hypothetical protein